MRGFSVVSFAADGGRLATYRRIAKVDLKIPPHVSLDARDLIIKVRRAFQVAGRAAHVFLQLLKYNPEHRIPLKDVANHPWITKYRPKGLSRGGSDAY